MDFIEGETLVLNGGNYIERVAEIPRGEYFVYSWFRKGLCLYVGSSGNIKQRLTKHLVIGIIEPVEETDVFFLERQYDALDAQVYEKHLILVAQPVFNTAVKHSMTLSACRVKLEVLKHQWIQIENLRSL